MRVRAVALLTGAVLCAACHTPLNYLGTQGPRYAGGPAAMPAAGSAGPLRIVTFNVKYARRVDSAIVVLESEQSLRDADLIMLQEMDAPGTERIARALGLGYVYYPATVHPGTRNDFGNAILTRWPMVSDAKILLPHRGRGSGTARAATAATIRVGGRLVRVYSVHLGTPTEIGPRSRRDQILTILADAEGYPQVVVGGDMNNHELGYMVRDHGYQWPTERGPRTGRLGRWDHLFLKGFHAVGGDGTGTVLDNRGASDHRPVWAFAAPEAAPSDSAPAPKP
ncbi:MAG: endonuclease/exonuclease/phosphatase family protein [Gemmatimonadales bacterium]|nr:endonuclease/exonuclease/phosphatase family protein [Gemmatimonadales bacterium]